MSPCVAREASARPSQKDLESVWEAAFDGLSEDEARLMGLLCFMGPESIPLSLLEPSEGIEYSQAWKLLQDGVRIKDAQEGLLGASLIRANVETGVIAVHRLLQDAYFDRLPPTSRAACFEGALSVLRAHFPGRHEGNGHLYSRWDGCSSLHQHVQALRQRYNTMAASQGFSASGTSYFELVRDDAWYMIEMQQFLDAEKALQSLLSDISKESLAAAKVNRDLLGLYERTGRSTKACSSARAELAIMLEHDVPKDNDLANAYSNVGYALVSAHNGAEALHYLDIAVSMAKSCAEPECYENYNIDRFLRNRGRANQQLKRFDEALRDFDEAEFFQAKLYGPGSHYDGETKHERAKIAAWQRDLGKAYHLSQQAHELVSQGKLTNSSVMAAQYCQGWVAALRGNDGLALQHLQKALAISQLNEQHRGNAGETARIKWRISQVYERQGKREDSILLREHAREVKEELMASGDYAIVEDEDASWDALIGLLYR